MNKKEALQKTVIVTHLNCCRVNKNKIQILDILGKTQADIDCVYETNFGKKNHPIFEGYTVAGIT